MKQAANYIVIILLLCFVGGCRPHGTLSRQFASLTDARRGFKTTLVPSRDTKEAVEQAPASVFRTLKYPASSGELAAYLTPDPGDGRRHPAILWITGGDCNSIGDVWTASRPDNDQTAAAFRQAGIIMMFASLRGGNDNPGQKEGFLGEVDDVLAAEQYLEKQPYVDPTRIYLGGHSTGGTLALLVAESSSRFRAVFSFGPIDDVRHYGTDTDFLPFDLSNDKEAELRSPGYWLSSVQSPVWVMEGTQQGNIASLRAMARSNANPKAHFIPIGGATHFSTLAPTNALLAQKILRDTGATSNIVLSEEEVNHNFAQ